MHDISRRTTEGKEHAMDLSDLVVSSQACMQHKRLAESLQSACMENTVACGGREPWEGLDAGEHRILRAISDSVQMP